MSEQRPNYDERWPIPWPDTLVGELANRLVARVMCCPCDALGRAPCLQCLYDYKVLDRAHPKHKREPR